MIIYIILKNVMMEEDEILKSHISGYETEHISSLKPNVAKMCTKT